MQKTLALCLTAALLAATPLAAANAYAYSGTLDGRLSLVAVASSHVFTFDADAGDLVEVTLTWADATKDLDLTLATPDGTCDLSPDPDAACLVDRYARAPACARARPVTGPHGEETITLTAAETGTFVASVLASLAPGSTAYTLTISVDGAAPVVEGPLTATTLDRNVHCKAP